MTSQPTPRGSVLHLSLRARVCVACVSAAVCTSCHALLTLWRADNPHHVIDQSPPDLADNLSLLSSLSFFSPSLGSLLSSWHPAARVKGQTTVACVCGHSWGENPSACLALTPSACRVSEIFSVPPCRWDWHTGESATQVRVLHRRCRWRWWECSAVECVVELVTGDTGIQVRMQC